MRWRRKERDPKNHQPESAEEKLQHWDRDPQPFDTVAGAWNVPDTGEGPGEVYPDEIDPEWRDPESEE